MKILHVIASLARDLGGPSQACVGMAEAVAALGHDVRICTSMWPGDSDTEDIVAGEAFERNGVTYHYFDGLRPRIRGLSLGMIRALPRLIGDVDLVHLHSLYLAHTWATGDICHRKAIPYVIRPHGTLDPYIYRRKRPRKFVAEQLFQNRVNRNAAAFHFTTQDEMELAAPFVSGRPGFVAPLGVALERFASAPPPGGLRAKFPQLGTRGIVLFYGRLNFKKGFDILIPAFAEAVRQGQDLALVIAGPDHGMEAKVRESVVAHGVGERCVFTGMLERDDALVALNDADLFVLPSYSENFGISVVEAMACGLPVLISDRVNIWREVEADGAGLVAPPETAAFAKLLVEIMADPARREAMGEAARASVAHRFTWDKVGHRLSDVYSAILENRTFQPLMDDPGAMPGVAA